MIKAVAGSNRGTRALLVSNLGHTSRELYWAADGPGIFYMLGSMGLASSVALGVSLAQREKEVIAIDGDASVLMNMGTLATIAASAGGNFHLVIVDNHVHGSTGSQPSHTAKGANLGKIAKAAGIKSVAQVRDTAALRRLLNSRRMPAVVVALCEPSFQPAPTVPLRPEEIRDRFIASARR